ncbi:DUF1127 domain-containing protein [Methylobacterium durans]
MLASVARFVRLWYRTRRAYRELELLDDRGLEDIGLNPCEASRHRMRL